MKLVWLLTLFAIYYLMMGVHRLSRRSGKSLGERRPVLAYALSVALFFGLLSGVDFLQRHWVDRQLRTWMQANGYGERAFFAPCTEDGGMRTALSGFQPNYYYLIIAQGHDERVVQLGDWLVGRLSTTVTVIR